MSENTSDSPPSRWKILKASQFRDYLEMMDLGDNLTFSYGLPSV